MSYYLESVALFANFAHFARDRRLPESLFSQPDHVALHANNIQDFDRRVKEIEPLSDELIVREAHQRFIVAARLAGPLAVADLGRVRWLEIIEPISEEAELGLISGDHVEFLYPDFSGVRAILGNRNIGYRIDEDPQPRIKVPFGSGSDEFRFTKRPLGEIVAKDLAEGDAKSLKKAA